MLAFLYVPEAAADVYAITGRWFALLELYATGVPGQLPLLRLNSKRESRGSFREDSGAGQRDCRRNLDELLSLCSTASRLDT